MSSSNSSNERSADEEDEGESEEGERGRRRGLTSFCKKDGRRGPDCNGVLSFSAEDGCIIIGWTAEDGEHGVWYTILPPYSISGVELDRRARRGSLTREFTAN